MLIHLIAPNNYISFNIKLANVLGLKTSVYLSELLSIQEKALRKNKINDDSFVLDRNYIKDRTTLTLDEQLDIEKSLFKIKVLTQTEKTDTIQININNLARIVMETDPDLLKDVSNISNIKKTARQTKTEKILSDLRSSVVTTYVPLREAYFEWIEAVQQKQGFLHKKAVISAQAMLDEHCKNNVEEKIKILEIATINGYRDIMWAINNYKKNYTPIYKTTPIKVSPPALKKRLDDEVF